MSQLNEFSAIFFNHSIIVSCAMIIDENLRHYPGFWLITVMHHSLIKFIFGVIAF